MPARRKRRRRRARERRGQRHDAGGACAARSGASTSCGSSGTRAPFTPCACADLHHQRRDGGMQMEMLVGVDVIERQAGGGEGRELGLDLGRQLARAPWAERTSPRRPAPCRCGNARWHRPDRAPRAAGSTGLPSTSTRCRPTRKRRHGLRARAPHRRRQRPPPSGWRR